MEVKQHPKYGPYQPGWKTIPGFPKYEVNEYSQIRNKTTQCLIQRTPQTNQVGLRTAQGTYRFFLVYHLTLLVFFPHIEKQETVDHTDENRDNHFIENLQWCSYAENTRKSCSLRPRKSGPARFKAIEQWKDNVKIAEFVSIKAAAQHMKTNISNISACARGATSTCQGFSWKFKPQPDLPGERWDTNEKAKELMLTGLYPSPISVETSNKILISNKGRIWTAKGVKTKGSIDTRKPKYRRFGHLGIHQLVWAVFGDRPLKPGEVICHTDAQPLDEDGCCSNAIEHLRADTQSNNIKESWQTGNNRHRKRRKTYVPETPTTTPTAPITTA